MGYVVSNLMAGEDLVHVGKIHWFIFVPGLLMLCIAIWLVSADLSEEYWKLVGTALLLASIISLVKAFIFKISTELAVTTKRVIAKIGLISRSTVELNHSKVESFNVDQSIAGRIFGFGTVTVCGTGGGRTTIPNIDGPLEFRKQAMSLVDRNNA